MSVPETPRPARPAACAARPAARGCLSVLLALIGIVLMLPGVCSAGLRGGIRAGRRIEPGGSIVGIWMLSFLLAAARQSR